MTIGMIFNYITRLLITVVVFTAGSGALRADDTGSRDCRNLIVEGNRLFKQERWSEAEVKYQKALQADPTSQVAQFNLASTLVRQGRLSDLQDPNSSMSRACNTFRSMIANPESSTVRPDIIEKSFYNLGNVAYEQQNYSDAIEMYKGALRINPNNDKARENLRLAQLKLQQQKKNDNQDENKEEKKEQQEKQQNEDKKQDKPKPQEDKKEQQPQQQPQGGINDENAARILKTMENEEAATRRRIQLQHGKRGNTHPSRGIGNPW